MDYHTPADTAFPNSAVAVETAVPAFIGYTSKAERNGSSCLRIPSRITSLAEYLEVFGGGFKQRFSIEAAGGEERSGTISSGGRQLLVRPLEINRPLFFDSIRLFYANGGGACYILSLGLYGDAPSFSINAQDFDTSTEFPESPLQLLEKEREITLINIPEAAGLPRAKAYALYQQVLAHCAKMQNRFAILDLPPQQSGESNADLFRDFRGGIGADHLGYGAAYYPWLNTLIIQPDEIDLDYLNPAIDLAAILPENGIREIIAAHTEKGKTLPANEQAIKDHESSLHQALRAVSGVYGKILDEIRTQLNQLPPGAAIAGIYTFVDSTRGVWKAPANVSLNAVRSPVVAITNEEQAGLQIDVLGRSINPVREFTGEGALIWGARTLDGNSLDWRYVNVRRTMIMIEESVKLAVRAYIFEPNVPNTWVTVKSTLSNFMVSLWKQGALAGAAPEEAFEIYLGLGSTMTPEDVLDGRMVITMLVAISRPAEFIEISFQQQQVKG